MGNGSRCCGQQSHGARGVRGLFSAGRQIAGGLVRRLNKIHTRACLQGPDRITEKISLVWWKAPLAILSKMKENVMQEMPNAGLRNSVSEINKLQFRQIVDKDGLAVVTPRPLSQCLAC